MLSEPSIAALIAGPLESLGISHSASKSVALVLGTALSTVFLMVVGELVPKNWAISSPLPWRSGWGTRSAGSVPRSARSSAI
jgi:CBS domain containing-hemolysin-like protein